MNRRFCRHTLAATAIALSGLMLVSAPAHAGEIKRVMKLMKQDYNGAVNSTSIAEMAPYVHKLQADVTTASKLSLSGDQATYNKGMQTLLQQVGTVDHAVQANDLNAAKAALKQINMTRHHYHDLLN